MSLFGVDWPLGRSFMKFLLQSGGPSMVFWSKGQGSLQGELGELSAMLRHEVAHLLVNS